MHFWTNSFYGMSVHSWFLMTNTDAVVRPAGVKCYTAVNNSHDKKLTTSVHKYSNSTYHVLFSFPYEPRGSQPVKLYEGRNSS